MYLYNFMNKLYIIACPNEVTLNPSIMDIKINTTYI